MCIFAEVIARGCKHKSCICHPTRDGEACNSSACVQGSHGSITVHQKYRIQNYSWRSANLYVPHVLSTQVYDFVLGPEAKEGRLKKDRNLSFVDKHIVSDFNHPEQERRLVMHRTYTRKVGSISEWEFIEIVLVLRLADGNLVSAGCGLTEQETRGHFPRV